MFHFKKRLASVKSKLGKKLWYPVVVTSRQVVDTRKIARELAARSGISEGEAIGFLHDLGLLMREHLAEGSRVVLEGIGSFKISAQARGNGVEEESKVSAMQFNHVKVLFLPESRVNRVLGTKEVTLIDTERMKFSPVPEPKDEEQGDKPGGSDSGNSGGSTPDTGGHAGI